MSAGKTPLDRQAVVKLFNRSTKDTVWQTTNDNSEASFGDLIVAQYQIEVSAVGYLTTHQDFNVGSALRTYNVDITLERDPSAIDLDVSKASQMPPKARKETQRSVTALKSGKYKDAQKHLDAAYKLVPNSADVNFLLGYLAVQNKDFEHAESYLKTATGLDTHSAQAPTLLGRIFVQRGEYEAARTTLEQAVQADPEYWMAHNLLADAYLHQHDYDKAMEQARLAMEKGKGAGNSAQLVLGEALGNLGKNQEAVQTLKGFLQDSPSTPNAPQVRNLIAELEHRVSNPGEAVTAVAVRTPPPLVTSDPLIAEPDPRISIKTWEPPGIDDMKPYVAADVTCPYQHVIDETGERVKQLVDDVSQIAAIEDLLHERVDELGNAVTKETRKFNYVVSISEPKPGWLST
ncbi:MAG TPA: tetratricopeptide repeat protein, partial [Terriglobales bacterium]|nr:tetratricopeptide repeat protein [Terriglobales bacterium]